jgi:hypothetical protein
VVHLEYMLSRHSSICKRRIVKVLNSITRREKITHAQMLELELVITGERIFELCGLPCFLPCLGNRLSSR